MKSKFWECKWEGWLYTSIKTVPNHLKVPKKGK